MYIDSSSLKIEIFKHTKCILIKENCKHLLSVNMMIFLMKKDYSQFNVYIFVYTAKDIVTNDNSVYVIISATCINWHSFFHMIDIKKPGYIEHRKTA